MDCDVVHFSSAELKLVIIRAFYRALWSGVMLLWSYLVDVTIIMPKSLCVYGKWYIRLWALVQISIKVIFYFKYSGNH